MPCGVNSAKISCTREFDASRSQHPRYPATAIPATRFEIQATLVGRGFGPKICPKICPEACFGCIRLQSFAHEKKTVKHRFALYSCGFYEF